MNQQSLKHYTRGGQITLHNFRMFTQITNRVALAVLVVFLFVSGGMLLATVSDYERYVFGEYVWSNVIPLFNEKAETDFIQPNGKKIKVKYTDIHDAKLIEKVNTGLIIKLLKAIIFGSIAAIITMVCISIWLKRRGQEQTENLTVRGDVLASKEMTTKIILKEGTNSDFKLGNLPLIKNGEIMHFLFHGTTRSGKSNAIKDLLDQIRKRGDRALIYDKGCNLLSEFFQPSHDILLSPQDVRTKNWGLWLECQNAASFDNLAAALIPMSSHLDPFWVNAARIIFSSTAFQMRNDPNRSIAKLLYYLLTPDLDIVQEYLKGTPASTLVSEKIEKTAICIKSTLATYIKSLKYVNDQEGELFSIRQWIKNEKNKHWLFFTSQGNTHESMKPLLTAWLDIAVNELISLPDSSGRRIWVILDELYSLQKLPYLQSFLSEAGKFGGCAVIGLQSYAQLEEVYGEKGACIISALLNTRFLFKQPDPNVARWSAFNLGEAITEEVNEGISYGANSMRDGISINKVETRKPLVSYSEIMSLAQLNAFVRLPGKYPITPVDFIPKDRQKINPGFILREDNEILIKEIDELIEKSEQSRIVLSEEELKQVYLDKKMKRTKKIEKKKKIKTNLVQGTH